MQAEWVAVDWGTSNLRAWGIGPDGETVFARQSDRGMGRLTPADYPNVLTALVGDGVKSGNDGADVVICGMAGARQGWLEAPYLDTPADLAGLAFGAVTPAMPNGRLRPRILPGICQKTGGAEDVMRGEETQLLGLAALRPGFAGLVVMPGTHSKWARLDGSRVEQFSTAMTGELYEVLRQHSVLRHSLNGDVDGPERDAGFEAGLDLGIDAPEKLTATLFKVRAGSLLSGRGPDWCAGLLSGLLIGAEIGGHRDWLGDGEIPLIGGTSLCTLYARGFAKAGAHTAIIDAAEASLAGLKAARNEAST
jgi:2-dehydro-3-deoxygalactonokinase